jgi:integrase
VSLSRRAPVGARSSALDYREVERLIRSAYCDSSDYGVMIKTLFLTGARVNEFVHIRVDLHLNDEDIGWRLRLRRSAIELLN